LTGTHAMTSILAPPPPGEAPNPKARGVVAALSVSVFLEWLGASAILPLLPLFLRQRGSSDALVGATMAAFFAAAFVVQYPVGRLSDRIGRRPLQIAGLVTYAVASLAFVVFAAPLTALLLRALQGAGAGAVDVASAAVIGETAAPSARGRAFALYYGCRIAGLAIGPLAGSIVGIGSMRIVFAAAAVCAVLAAVPVALYVPKGLPWHSAPGAPVLRVNRALWRRRSVLGVVVVAASIGLLTGIYEVCWSLLLHIRGAKSWQIGLSWTLFAIPFAAMSVPAGWLVDHFDRRYMAGLAMVASAGFACSYAFLRSVDVLIGLNATEAITVTLAYPAMLSQLNHVIDSSEIGRAQGFVSSSQTATTAVAASLAGALFGIAAYVPFVTLAACVLFLALLLVPCWHGIPGRTPRQDGVGSSREAPDQRVA
jgi:MFS family permease